MKKIVPILLTIFLLFSEAVYAEDAASTLPAPLKPPKPKTAIVKPGLQVKPPRRESSKEWAGAKAQARQICKNGEEIVNLKGEAAAAYKEAKSRVRELTRNKDSLTDEQIKGLKQAITKLAKDREVLFSTAGDIREENDKLKDAGRNKDLKAYKEALNNILTIQKTRINALKEVIEDMNSIAAM